MNICAGARQADCAGGDPVLPDPDGLHHRSAERRAANPDDKLFAADQRNGRHHEAAGTEPDRRSGDYVLWTDTAASLQRLLLGLAISTLVGLGFGLNVGLLPDRGASFGTNRRGDFDDSADGVLPILFIVFGSANCRRSC